MIVAVYKSGNALWAPVVPVTAIMRFNRDTGRQQSGKKPTDKKAVFATMLLSAKSELELAEGQELDARA